MPWSAQQRVVLQSSPAFEQDVAGLAVDAPPVGADAPDCIGCKLDDGSICPIGAGAGTAAGAKPVDASMGRRVVACAGNGVGSDMGTGVGAGIDAQVSGFVGWSPGVGTGASVGFTVAAWPLNACIRIGAGLASRSGVGAGIIGAGVLARTPSVAVGAGAADAQGKTISGSSALQLGYGLGVPRCQPTKGVASPSSTLKSTHV